MKAGTGFLLAAVASGWAAGDGLRNLTWGELNFLQTTDTHGWLPGHLSEPEYSANWGDYVSLIEHMRARADDMGADIIVVDTGDRHDGNGLSDATVPDGEVSQRIFIEADIDVVTVGNHELYQAYNTRQEYELMRPHYGERYLASNIDYQLANGSWTPMGNRYRVFETKNKGFRVLAFGFLFNFDMNAANSRVTPVENAIQEDWFQEAIRLPDIDIIVLAGHTPVRFFKEYDHIIEEIRKVKPDIVIQAFGGHTHIRDYRVWDERATGLEGGRYLETIGWASIQKVRCGPDDEPGFSRSYVDANPHNYAYHADVPEDEFRTSRGKSVSKKIAEARQLLNLTQCLACVPHPYYMNRAPFPSNNSIYSLLQDHVLPLLEPELASGVASSADPRYIFVNTGGIRFDMFAGQYTRDTAYIVSPFKNQWLYIPKVPVDVAEKILPLLNRQDKIADLEFSILGQASIHWPHTEEYDTTIDHDQHVFVSGGHGELSHGYVTWDDFGNEGDDTPHVPWPYFTVPNAVQTKQNVSPDTDAADIIFFDFMKPFIDQVLVELGRDDLIALTQAYSNRLLTELIPRYFHKLDTSDTCCLSS